MLLCIYGSYLCDLCELCPRLTLSEKNTLYLAVVAIVISVLAIGLTYTSESPPGLTGPEGPQGVAGSAGPAGPAGASVVLAAEPESCATCHDGAGADHQASYDELNQDSITVTDMAYDYDSPIRLRLSKYTHSNLHTAQRR